MQPGVAGGRGTVAAVSRHAFSGQTMKSRQHGAFLMARALLIVGILMAMLVIPAWLKRDRDVQQREVEKAETALGAPAVSPAPAASAPPRPIGHGLTFGPGEGGALPSDDRITLSCHAATALDRPNQGACNPGQGDTSCRTVLPVLCFHPGSDGAAAGLGLVGATRPVMGAVLESEAAASARCEQELGPGWRMADLRDGQNGWSLQGRRDASLMELAGRYWIRNRDQKANCWDSDA